VAHSRRNPSFLLAARIAGDALAPHLRLGSRAALFPDAHNVLKSLRVGA
jgi:hypothetical protein